MATLIENLDAINNCKEDIKNALVNKGVDMTGVVFSGYAEKINSLQLESGDTPTQSADYIYSNGYVEGETNDIMTYISYEIKTKDDGGQFVLDDNGNYTIELFAPIEYDGWEEVSVPDFIFGVDVPEKYELLYIETFNPLNKENPYFIYGNETGFKTNIRHEHINRQGITYNSYTRYTNGDYSSSDIFSDGDANKNPAKYKITIRLK